MAGGEQTPLVYRGAQEICAAVGIPWKEINYYVKEKKLPAWKIDGKSTWLAVPSDLVAWIIKQRDENLHK